MSAPVTAAPVTQLLANSTVRLRLGTRRSALARAQSRSVADRLQAAWAPSGVDVQVEMVEVTTHGDVDSAPLSVIGGTGVFVSALREALLDGRIDCAVHSLKDLPTSPADGLALAAVPLREDPRDVLVARDGLTTAELPAGAQVGTGSPRRAAQLRALGLGLEVVDVRGNVDTRLRFVHEGVLDAVVLARAGLLRLGRAAEATEIYDPLLMLPAPGQGALAVECRAGDTAVRQVLAAVDEPSSRLAVIAERTLLSTLEAGCAAPVGALAEVVDSEDGEELSLRAVAGSIDGAVLIRRSAVLPLPDSVAGGSTGAPPESTAPPDPGTFPGLRALTPSQEAAARTLGQALAEQMLGDGAADLMPLPAEGTTAPPAAQAREGDS